jgi:TolA-binding protein
MERRDRVIADVKGSEFDFGRAPVDEKAALMTTLAELYLEQARCLQGQKDKKADVYYENALRLCEAVKKEAPDLMPDRVEFCLGACNLRLGRTDEGRAMLDRLCQSHPNSVSCREARRLLADMESERK